jgi:hypothetical protein
VHRGAGYLLWAVVSLFSSSSLCRCSLSARASCCGLRITPRVMVFRLRFFGFSLRGGRRTGRTRLFVLLRVSMMGRRTGRSQMRRSAVLQGVLVLSTASWALYCSCFWRMIIHVLDLGSLSFLLSPPLSFFPFL